MVKNTHGGNKSKGLARKNTHSVSHDARHIRLPSCDFELLAVVEKLLGNGMFYASTTNEKTNGYVASFLLSYIDKIIIIIIIILYIYILF